MTASEKIKEIETLLEDKFPTCKTAERMQELRDGLKVSDLYKANDMTDISYDWAERILGYRILCGGYTICDKLEDAIKAEYIKTYQIRRYGQLRTYCALTAKAKAIMRV